MSVSDISRRLDIWESFFVWEGTRHESLESALARMEAGTMPSHPDALHPGLHPGDFDMLIDEAEASGVQSLRDRARRIRAMGELYMDGLDAAEGRALPTVQAH